MVRKYTILALVCGLTAAGTETFAQASTYKTVYNFQDGADSSGPQGNLLYTGGKLYGTTVGNHIGGLNPVTNGAVFSINPANNAEQTLYSFQGGADGEAPVGSLVNVGGVLYGATSGGGSAGYGTVFSVNMTTGEKTTLHSFQGGNDGTYPSGGLINLNGILYGVTAGDQGSTSLGTLYSIDPATSIENVIYSFKGGNLGFGPVGGLLDVGGTFYGATGGGYVIRQPGIVPSTIFAFKPSTGAFRTLHTFSEAGDGNGPTGYLTYLKGLIYGTTSEGGANYDGVIFSFDLASKFEEVVYSFQDGAQSQGPASGLTVVNGILYGTTSYGGESSAGSVFSFDPTKGLETEVYAWTGANGVPLGGVVKVGNKLFGTTNAGGYNYGSVFSIKP